MARTIHFIVTGTVQGVFFRAACRQAAVGLDICGWVRNLPDGRVEGMATAEPEKLQPLRDWLKRGPERAKVDKLEISEQPYQAFESFEVR
jgi:acylphosphatase